MRSSVICVLEACSERVLYHQAHIIAFVVARPWNFGKTHFSDEFCAHNKITATKTTTTTTAAATVTTTPTLDARICEPDNYL